MQLWKTTPAILALIGLVFALPGCQQPASTANINHAQFRQIENTVILPEAFDEVWQRVNAALDEGPFEIAAADYELGALQVVVETDPPGAYVDCGEAIRAYTGQMGGTDVYRFQIAESASYKGTDAQGRPFSADRSTSLAATAYIVLARVEVGTKVAVDAQYVFEVNTAIDSSDSGRGQYNEVNAVSFATNQRSEGALNCVATGRLESMILSAAQPPQ